MDNEIVELHPPLVTFASIEYDGEPLPPVQTAPPPPAPYDHKNNNLVVVNRNDLESILVSKAERNSQATAQKIPNIQRTFVSLESKKPNHQIKTPQIIISLHCVPIQMLLVVSCKWFEYYLVHIVK